MDTPHAFEFAKETVCQLLTLATALIGVSVTFAKDLKPAANNSDRKWLGWAWGILLISVVFGIWTLLALTGSLGRGQDSPSVIYETHVTMPSMLQIVTFLVGVLLLIVHAFKSRRNA